MEILDCAISCEKCTSPAFVTHLRAHTFVCWKCGRKLSSDKSYAELARLSKENRNCVVKAQLPMWLRIQDDDERARASAHEQTSA